MKYLLVGLLSVVGFALQAQVAYKLANFSLVVKGTSNLHDWQSTANEVRGSASVNINAASLSGIQSLQVEVPVRSIKSEKGSIMDNKTYQALDANNYPNISLSLVRVNKIEGSNVNTSCKLTIASVTNTITMNVNTKVNADGSITFSGTQKVKMTDYKVKPPTALLGTLTTGDEVQIVFNVTFKKA